MINVSILYKKIIEFLIYLMKKLVNITKNKLMLNIKALSRDINVPISRRNLTRIINSLINSGALSFQE